MTTGHAIIVIGFCTLGAMVQGSTGIGFTLVAGPAIIAVDPAFAPGPFLLVAQLVSLRHIAAERELADRVALRHALYGLPVGLAAAILVLEVVNERVLAVLIGSLTALAATALLIGYQPTRTRRTEILGGLGSSFSGVAAGLPGPPLAIAFNDMRPPTMRASTAMFVINVAVFGMLSLLATGNYGWTELRLTAWLVPGAILGLIAARWVRPVIDRTWFRPTVLVLALLGGMALVLRQL